MDCIFCKIIAGDIPSYKVYEDDFFLAILDISQATKGHTLVLPKKHCETLLDLEDDLARKMLLVVRDIAKRLAVSLNAKGVNILNNNGKDAGQTVNHLHFHILPRYEDDNLEIKFANNSSLYNLEEIQKQILR